MFLIGSLYREVQILEANGLNRLFDFTNLVIFSPLSRSGFEINWSFIALCASDYSSTHSIAHQTNCIIAATFELDTPIKFQ